MKRHPTFLAPRAAERGVALVITLFFIVIITIVVLGFMDSSRVERSVAQTHFERMRATTMANQGIEAVVATLRRETADPPRQSGETDAKYDQRRRNWTSQPGQLTVPDDPKTGTTVDQKRLVKTVKLYSGAPSPTFLQDTTIDPILRSPNLNVRTLVEQSSPTYLLDDPPKDKTAVEMKLRWIYQREKPDGNNNYFALDTDGQPSEKPLLDPNNPIVGRFAYWADDESTKVNYNLGWSREAKVGDKNYNKNQPGHQTKIDLRALPSFTDDIALNLHTAVTADKYYASINRFFNSPFDARQTDDPAIRAALDLNKFNLTHYNSDPDTTYYGKARMMLTTQLNNAALRDRNGNVLLENGKPLTRPFLDILRTSNADPGLLNNIDGNKLSAVIATLVNDYLKRNDWPMVDGTGHSLQEKYYSDYNEPARTQRLAQIALNIIDYVRSAESPKLVVEPIRGLYKGTQFVGDFTDTSLRGKEDTFKGLVRAPYITEMGVWVASKAETSGLNTGRFRSIAFIEVYLPTNYGLDALDLINPESGKRWWLYFKEFGSGNYRLADGSTAVAEYKITQRANRATPVEGSPIFVLDSVGNPANAVIKPGEYRTIAMEVWRHGSTRPSTVVMRSAISIGTSGATGNRIDVAPLGDPPNVSPLNYTVQTFANDTAPGFDPKTNIRSYETVDPRVNGVAVDWKLTASSSGPPNTFSAENKGRTDSVGQSPLNVVPEQDLAKDGKVSAASLRMPYPAGHVNNPTGRVRSPGELGLIHTGIEGSSKAPRGGVPWRSLRLQPGKQGTKVVPDWAFMDLFTVPADVPQKAAVLFAPRGSSTGGRVNMNAEPEPFELLKREDPLAAVLFGCRWTNDPKEQKPTLDLKQATDIARAIYARNRAATGKPYPAPQANLPDVYESPGEVVEIAGVADKGEESEELVREIANLITARGNVFSVYTIGQSMKQTPSGKLLVTGEQRQQAYLERYLVDKGTNTPDDNSVGFRTIYFRNLIP